MPVAPKIMTFIRAHRYHDAESLDGGTGTVTTSHGSCDAAPGARPDVSSVAATLVRPEVADTPGPATSATAESDRRFTFRHDRSMATRCCRTSRRSRPTRAHGSPSRDRMSKGKLAWWEPARRHFAQEILAARSRSSMNMLTVSPRACSSRSDVGGAYWRFPLCIESRRRAPTPTCFFAKFPDTPLSRRVRNSCTKQ